MSDAPTSAEIKLDVREISPRERHPLIFNTYDALGAGASMLLINDHDPKPLYYQLKAERQDLGSWDYIEEGPEIWQVRISKRAQ